MSDKFPQTLLDNDLILFVLLIDTINRNRILVYGYRVSVLWKHDPIIFKLPFRASYCWSACWCSRDGSLVCRNVNVLVSSMSGPGLGSVIILCQWIGFFPPNPTSAEPSQDPGFSGKLSVPFLISHVGDLVSIHTWTLAPTLLSRPPKPWVDHRLKHKLSASD